MTKGIFCKPYTNNGPLFLIHADSCTCARSWSPFSQPSHSLKRICSLSTNKVKTCDKSRSFLGFVYKQPTHFIRLRYMTPKYMDDLFSCRSRFVGSIPTPRLTQACYLSYFKPLRSSLKYSACVSASFDQEDVVYCMIIYIHTNMNSVFRFGLHFAKTIFKPKKLNTQDVWFGYHKFG